jgi:hypothetical protein
MIVRHAPWLAAVPEIKSHKPITYADANGIQPMTAMDSTPGLPTGSAWRLKQAKQLFDSLLIAASRGWLGAHDRNYYVHYDECIRHINPVWFRTRLLDNSLAADWFNVSALKKLFDEHMSRKQDHSIRINNVVAFLAWLETVGI